MLRSGFTSRRLRSMATGARGRLGSGRSCCGPSMTGRAHIYRSRRACAASLPSRSTSCAIPPSSRTTDRPTCCTPCRASAASRSRCWTRSTSAERGPRNHVTRPYYPVYFDLRDRPVLVIGGGRLALEKVEGLLAAEACVTVVAPALSRALRSLADEGRIAHIAKEYERGDMRGMTIVMAACEDASSNRELQDDARALGVPLNAADDPGHCDFILPAVVRRPPLTLAISTGGGSPAVARRVREELTDYLDADTSSMAELVAEVRADLRRLHAFRAIPSEAWQSAMDGQVRILLAQRRRGQAKALLLARLGAPIRATDEAS
ncbi:MAG: bifunctional precorrin-2 dehydrogenase/sirohydrochlorin ferrochelatase [Chloroflexi bacterium]|nr:bifunctional precorrin-2 dehydrogenase/sirohydrochlorin ferrochelatase [Chloroflexota bacterium]MYF81554.1 bifunctional precorrin-2 dehydrogenase/sirohydrochlorin ferrochelatase [Chloroflexota bacterium]MYI05356.1 bifunctional precorrin-2 dehydrogenase/sirohydrochlorin ferrochelatase [Chloroflexota bacterium]